MCRGRGRAPAPGQRRQTPAGRAGRQAAREWRGPGPDSGRTGREGPVRDAGEAVRVRVSSSPEWCDQLWARATRG